MEEFAPLPEGAVVRLDGEDDADGDERCAVGRLWQDAIDLRGADPLLRYAEGHLADQAAATRHPYGRGEAFYLGTLPDRATLRGLVEKACLTRGSSSGPISPPASRRSGAATTCS